MTRSTFDRPAANPQPAAVHAGQMVEVTVRCRRLFGDLRGFGADAPAHLRIEPIEPPRH